MTGIEWTDATWNPLTGCAHVSPGCDGCYAAREAAGRLSGNHRYAGLAVRPEGGGLPRFTGEIRLHPDRVDQPLRWRKPRRVFVNSMSDLFHPDVPDEFIVEVFSIMQRAESHQFQVLTKRPQRMADLLSSDWFRDELVGMPEEADIPSWPYPFPNVWLGTSIESDRYAFRADHGRHRTPAAVRFISAEPLLGPLQSLDLTGIDWLIVGGESGPQARPMHPDWVRGLRRTDESSGSSAAMHQEPSARGQMAGSDKGSSQRSSQLV
ncbi:MAG: phage Gp37/Gp68 family protein [Actinomycetota bacterium]